MKRCNGCSRNLEAFNFYSDKSKEDGLATRCRECKKIYTRRYYREHPEWKKEYDRQYALNNKKLIDERGKTYRKREGYRQYKKEYDKKYYAKNRERIYLRNKEYKERHKKQLKEATKRWCECNKEKIKARAKEYRQKNLHKRRERYANDLNYRLSIAFRNSIRCHLQRSGNNKKAKTTELIGCSTQQLHEYLES